MCLVPFFLGGGEGPNQTYFHKPTSPTPGWSFLWQRFVSEFTFQVAYMYGGMLVNLEYIAASEVKDAVMKSFRTSVKNGDVEEPNLLHSQKSVSFLHVKQCNYSFI